MSQSLRSLAWEGDSLKLLDQTKLPVELTYISCKDYKTVAEAIRVLAVRGAPAIGVAAAYGVVLAYRQAKQEGKTLQEIETLFRDFCDFLCHARPTAVNLSWAVHQMEIVYEREKEGQTEEALLQRAKEIEEADIHTCRSIGIHGADLFVGRKDLHILTHCNTGALATAGIGTAFGVIATLHERGQIGCVYADETRPLLQGSRLTATELMEGHIPCCLISDTMSASVMKQKHIDAIIVGADRIASNGDTANKIGTYGLAVMAQYHHIPFYIAAPFSTFDFSIQNGEEIVIEERNPDEVRKINGVYSAPVNVPVYNPAFDVTPASLIAGIITEKGVLQPPYVDSIGEYKDIVTSG